MTTCRRNNCNDRIYRTTPAGKLRLCEKHYQTYCRNHQNKEQRKMSVCHYCGVSLTDSRNDKYCSVYHRQLASRKLQNYLLTHSYWYRTESIIARSPFRLYSVTSIDDVADLILLHKRKAKHQRSYFPDTADALRPIPLFRLELCHLYPVSKGGMNIAANIIIAPMLINRLIGDKIPAQHSGFSGVKATGDVIPLSGSLYDSLVARFGSQAVIEKLGSIKLNRFYGNVPRPVDFGGMDRALPLFNLLVEESRRPGLQKQHALFISLKRTYGRLLPFLLELIAAAGFYAILTGDRERFLFRLCRFHDWFLSEDLSLLHPFRIGGLQHFERVLALMLNKYLYRFFAVDCSDPEAIIRFYNGFFSLNVLAAGMPGEIVCFNWKRGKRYQSVTPDVCLI